MEDRYVRVLEKDKSCFLEIWIIEMSRNLKTLLKFLCGVEEKKQNSPEERSRTGNYTFFPHKNAFANMGSAIPKYNPTLKFKWFLLQKWELHDTTV